MFKIKLIRKDYNTQIEKKIYENTKKFIKYGAEYYRRKHNNKYNCHDTEAFTICFKMNVQTEEWEEINPSEYFDVDLIEDIK